MSVNTLPFFPLGYGKNWNYFILKSLPDSVLDFENYHVPTLLGACIFTLILMVLGYLHLLLKAAVALVIVP